jgi:hypothetical protein
MMNRDEMVQEISWLTAKLEEEGLTAEEENRLYNLHEMVDIIDDLMKDNF